MYLGKTEVKSIKAISLLGMSENLSEGDKKLERKIFDEVKDSQYGNQEFSNDTLFIYPISTIKEDRDEIQELIYKYCNERNVIEDDDEFGLIYFAVCW